MELPRSSELEGRHERLFQTSKFLGKMILAGLFFRLFLFVEPSTVFLQQSLASLTTGALNLLGLELSTQGILILSPTDSYIVTQDCLGWKSMAVFSALIFASTDSLKHNLKSLTVGLVALTGINFVRVVTTVYLSHLDIISFELIHTVFWKWGLSLIVLAIWLVWLTKYRE